MIFSTIKLTPPRGPKGFTLVEALVSVLMLVVILTATSGGFTELMAQNRRSEFRGDAISLGRSALDNIRGNPVDLMPLNEEVLETVTLDNHEFDVNVIYCPDNSTLCNADTRRHIRIEVSLSSDSDRLLYETETIFTRLD